MPLVFTYSQKFSQINFQFEFVFFFSFTSTNISQSNGLDRNNQRTCNRTLLFRRYTVTTQSYLEMLNDFLLKYVRFMQDKAPAHFIR